MFNTQIIPTFDRSRMEAIMKRIKDRRKQEIAKEEAKRKPKNNK